MNAREPESWLATSVAAWEGYVIETVRGSFQVRLANQALSTAKLFKNLVRRTDRVLTSTIQQAYAYGRALPW